MSNQESWGHSFSKAGKQLLIAWAISNGAVATVNMVWNARSPCDAPTRSITLSAFDFVFPPAARHGPNLLYNMALVPSVFVMTGDVFGWVQGEGIKARRCPLDRQSYNAQRYQRAAMPG
jgi:hypothetical protein